MFDNLEKTQQLFFVEKGNVGRVDQFLNRWLGVDSTYLIKDENSRTLACVFDFGGVDHVFIEKSSQFNHSAYEMNGSTSCIRLFVKSKDEVNKFYTRSLELRLNPLSKPVENKDSEYFKSFYFVVQDSFKQWWHIATSI